MCSAKPPDPAFPGTQQIKGAEDDAAVPCKPVEPLPRSARRPRKTSARTSLSKGQQSRRSSAPPSEFAPCCSSSTVWHKSSNSLAVSTVSTSLTPATTSKLGRAASIFLS
eukprot:TRINITY_DN17379_c0_g1_i3.p2 TRINITY_DN17379_c0_g1~~TRINITY_DN17379_c0_g1_i3.p2  ORF type:complete len:110 (+),score=13.69 TRINITY_DN17379_c0_g1_i3:729-1058(+)